MPWVKGLNSGYSEYLLSQTAVILNLYTMPNSGYLSQTEVILNFCYLKEQLFGISVISNSGYSESLLSQHTAVILNICFLIQQLLGISAISTCSSYSEYLLSQRADLDLFYFEMCSF